MAGIVTRATGLQLLCGPRRHSQIQQQRLWEGEAGVMKGAGQRDGEGGAMPRLSCPPLYPQLVWSGDIWGTGNIISSHVQVKKG